MCYMSGEPCSLLNNFCFSLGSMNEKCKTKKKTFFPQIFFSQVEEPRKVILDKVFFPHQFVCHKHRGEKKLDQKGSPEKKI